MISFVVKETTEPLNATYTVLRPELLDNLITCLLINTMFGLFFGEQDGPTVSVGPSREEATLVWVLFEIHSVQLCWREAGHSEGSQVRLYEVILLGVPSGWPEHNECSSAARGMKQAIERVIGPRNIPWAIRILPREYLVTVTRVG